LSKSIGSRIKARRKELNISQRQLAEMAGTSQTIISKLETDGNDSSRYLVKIANALQCEPYWLESGEANPPPPTVLKRDLGIDTRLAALESELRVIREMSSRILLEVIAMRSELKADKGTDR